MSKEIKGKAIYSPQGKAGEYAKYAVNFYVGCSNDCTYCYCKRGLLGHAMGQPQATLKKCFKNEEHAIEVFRKELLANLGVLQKHGLFFTFTSDPMIVETIGLTLIAVSIAVDFQVPCKILTKRADFVDRLPKYFTDDPRFKKYVAFGFTLTGHDELEPGASTNAERIESMKALHKFGFKTFASIEPVISIEASSRMIVETLGHCDLYKIGLLSGKREYSKTDVVKFTLDTAYVVSAHNLTYGARTRIYFKDSIVEYGGYSRDEIRDASWMFKSMVVEADYNLFE